MFIPQVYFTQLLIDRLAIRTSISEIVLEIARNQALGYGKPA